jgi:hypothetical protein
MRGGTYHLRLAALRQAAPLREVPDVLRTPENDVLVGHHVVLLCILFALNRQ